MKVISVCCQKGGVSKTSTVQAVLTGLLNKGFRTLAIDLDSQQTLSVLTGANTETDKTILEVINGDIPATEAIQHTKQGDIIPASLYMIQLEKETKLGREYALKEAISPLSSSYDFILLDTAPHIGEVNIKALTCSDFVIIPALADIVSLIALNQIGESIEAVRKYTNKDLKILGILLTKYNSRTLLNKELMGILSQQAEALNTKVFSTTIRETVQLRQAQANFESIYTYCPQATATQDYLAFIDEMLGSIE